MATAVGFPDSSALVLPYGGRRSSVLFGCYQLVILYHARHCWGSWFCSERAILSHSGEMLALTPAGSVPLPSRHPLLFSPESPSGPLVLKGTAAKTQSLLVLKQQHQPGGNWQGIGPHYLGLGAEKCSPCELHHHVASVPKCVRVAGGDSHRWPCLGKPCGVTCIKQLPSWFCLQW